ncbi:DNA repair helicase [Auriscalpium vulgare]|uniref:DNA repair helicase n=1 Tax=Auriscalpium vulgare TaxID=40419 RepID=A0ACB8S2J6_9AGAM|nr:DNA repair helicase [Auriscalpium vulgare]
MSTSLTLSTPQDFPIFPYNPPYSIQTDLMRHLYAAIEARNLAIVESPTGTGKTLSLLSSTLTWLDDDRDRARKGQLDELARATDDPSTPSWVLAQTVDRLRRNLEADEAEYEARLAEARKREAAQRKMAAGRVRKRRKVNPAEDAANSEDSDDAFLPESDSESDSRAGRKVPDFLKATLARELKEAETDDKHCVKIYYASRTHSQLAQVVPELRKLRRHNATSSIHSTSTKSTEPPITSKRILEVPEEHAEDRQTRVAPLASRKQLCLNEDLKKRIAARGGDLDEACRDLLSAGPDKRCSYLPRSDDPLDNRMNELRDQILASPKDIEDLVVAGDAAHTCPYFASRAAISQAEVVTLPYNLLLAHNAREALGIDLKDHVVVIDEAHNLLSTLLSLSTVSLPQHTLTTCIDQLSAYAARFKTRLSATHKVHLTRLVKLLSSLHSAMLEWDGRGLGSVLRVDEMLAGVGGGVEGVNVLEIREYLRKSKLAKKIMNYSKSAADKQSKNKKVSGTKESTSTPGTPPLYVVQEFIAALSEATDDGRIIFTAARDGQSAEIKYQSLNPSPTFRPVVDAARAVILAGGTMSPMSDFTAQLFSHVPANKLALFSCSHIIPPSNLLTLAISRGPRSGELTFKHANTHDPAPMIELGYVLQNFARLVPGGLVVFLPSYKVLNQAVKVWTEKGVLDGLSKKKKIFQEPATTAEVPSVLASYASEIRSNGGALLLAVVGAKLSEGLNFSDDLARMVVVVGLPYANLASPELQERLKHADRILNSSGSSSSQAVASGKIQFGAAGRELYENMCMNAVNQSIGRAIRHKGDWATLVLIDSRYQSEKIAKKLPGWIGKTLVSPATFGQAVKATSQFVSGKKL